MTSGADFEEGSWLSDSDFDEDEFLAAWDAAEAHAVEVVRAALAGARHHRALLEIATALVVVGLDVIVCLERNMDRSEANAPAHPGQTNVTAAPDSERHR